MNSTRFRLLGVIAATAIIASACSSTATSAPTQAPTPTPTVAPAASPAEATPVSPTAAPVPTIPESSLVKAGNLTICSDTSYPPQEALDPSTHEAIGSDIDLAKEIAKRLGLTLVVKTTQFDTIIPALQGANCDAIVSAQYITDDRKKQVDMIPYFHAAEFFVVPTGNPDNIKALTDMCGKTIAAEKGTTEADDIDAVIGKACTDAGKAKPVAKVFGADTDALLALQAHTVVAHFTDSPVAGYEVKKGNGAFEIVQNLQVEEPDEGISVLKSQTAVKASIVAALKAMIADGTYLTILKSWGVDAGAVPASSVQ
jgi:polar amino acid transport system substrate-binding protein